MMAKKYKYIPFSVLSNILSRLPVKSLKRFECVCKSWYDLIKDPNLAIQHLHYSTNGNQHCLQQGIRADHFSLLCVDERTQHVSRHRLNLPYFREILGPCNGIYCLVRVNVAWAPNLIALANVSLREFKVVPHLSIARPCFQTWVKSKCGFGFDRKFNDYKLVLIVDIGQKPGRESAQTKVELYSLRSNSWRELDHTIFPSDVIMYWYCSNIGTYVNGNSHWLVSNGTHYAILSFDMADEVFRVIWLPKFSDFERNATFVTINALYHDFVSVVVRPVSYIPDKICAVWFLQDYGDDESWTKLVTIGPIESIARSSLMLGLWRNVEFLFKDDNEQIISYNPNTQKITQKFQVRGLLRAYSESLVSIIGDQRDDQNMLFDIVEESDDPTLQQPTSS